jgi:hypothetical protein
MQQLSAARFVPFTMKRDASERLFVGRGQATAPDSLSVPVTQPFVCFVDPSDRSGAARAVLRSRNPEWYEKYVRLWGLE